MKTQFFVRAISCALFLSAALVNGGLFAQPVVMNDGDPGTTSLGTWSASTQASEMPYAGSALYADESGTYTFNPDLAPGTYRVSLWWTTRPHLSRGAPVTVLTTAGKVSMEVNQGTNGGQWNLLGTYDLDSTAYVRLSVGGSNKLTCADAVMFEPVGQSSQPPPTPDVAPAAPINLTATAGTAAINLTWDANTTDTDFASYEVHRSIKSGSEFSLLAQGLTQNTYSDAATKGTTFYYCVTALDAAEKVSPLSAQAWATIPASDLAPAVPTGLAATAGTNSISLDWNDNAASDLVAGYSVYRSTTTGSEFTLLAQSLTLSEYVDSTILAGTTYHYIAFASDAAGNTSPPSAQASAMVAPVLFQTLTWSSPTTNVDGTALTDLAGFKVHVGTVSRTYTSVFDAGKVNQLTVGPLPAGTYYFAVTSYDSSGNEGPYSNEVSYNLQ